MRIGRDSPSSPKSHFSQCGGGLRLVRLCGKLRFAVLGSAFHLDAHDAKLPPSLMGNGPREGGVKASTITLYAAGRSVELQEVGCLGYVLR